MSLGVVQMRRRINVKHRTQSMQRPAVLSSLEVVIHTVVSIVGKILVTGVMRPDTNVVTLVKNLSNVKYAISILLGRVFLKDMNVFILKKNVSIVKRGSRTRKSVSNMNKSTSVEMEMPAEVNPQELFNCSVVNFVQRVSLIRVM
jgi:hypothetical protein